MSQRQKLHEIMGLQDFIGDGITKIHEIEQEYRRIEQEKNEIIANSNFTVDVTVHKSH